jgi:hypothetical protein
MNDDDRNAAAPVSGATPAHAPVNFTDWAQSKIPHLSEVSNSNPDATLRRHNLVAVTDDLETARVLALDFERSTSADFDTTMLVLGHAVDRASTHEVDPEGVVSHAARRSLLGGIPGAIVFALIVGIGVWLITGNVGVTAGAAGGAAIFGFYSTAVWSFVIGTGQSEAYQQSFVDPDAADAILVAFHADTRPCLEDARRSVSHSENVRFYDVDAQGEIAS